MGMRMLVTRSLPLTESEMPGTGDAYGNETFDKLNSLTVQADGQNFEPSALPDGELRYIMEFGEPIDADQITRVLRQKFPNQFFHFDPLFASDSSEDLRFHALRFDLTSKALNTSDLFDVAYALREEFELVSCEPDAVTLPDVSIDDQAELDDLAAPADRHWCVKNIRATKAHNLAISRGMGASIGLPGMSLTSHDSLDDDAVELVPSNGAPVSETSIELKSGRAKAPGVDVVAMASVAVSRQSEEIVGVAPKAKIVSITDAFSNLDCNGAALARAIDHAVVAGCNIVMLRQSGFYCSVVEQAIKRAVASNIIVLAAAGDSAAPISYPARYPGVIAVGGSTHQDLPWEQSASGLSVSFLAPAEFVWAAKQSANRNDVAAQNGTALAVAVAAGGAALWLSHHGVEQLSEHAKALNCSLQELFRHAVRQTARRPNNWDGARYGAGIIDCEALIKLQPDQILKTDEPLTMFPDKTLEMASLVQECTDQLPKGREFDFTTFGSEISMLAYAHLKTDGAGHRVADDVENYRPSKHLQNAIKKSGDKALLQFLNQS